MSAVIICCSDQPLLAEGIRVAVEGQGTMQMASVLPALNDLPAAVEAYHAAVAIVDWCPGFGWQAVSYACRSSLNTKFVLIARRLTPEVAFQARDAGVSAVMDSGASLGEFLDVIRRVLAGELVFDGAMDPAARSSRKVRLTPREGELVGLLAQGLKNKEIAECLDISEGTVKVYLSRLFEKVGAKDRFELALFGLKNLANTEIYLPVETRPELSPVEPHAKLRSLYLRSSLSMAGSKPARAASIT